MKKHWYALTFQAAIGVCSTYVGYNDTLLSLPRIKKAKEGADFPPTAVLVGATYLGHMTEDEFRTLS